MIDTFLKQKKVNKSFLFIACFVILSIPNSQALGEKEYLLEGEVIGSQLITFEMEGSQYYIYDIQNRKLDGFIVVGTSDQTISQENVKKVFFVYFTSKYMTDNQGAIRDWYQKTYYDLDTKSRSIYQQILNVYQKIPERCFLVPKFELIKICVKPTDRIEIMKIMDKTKVIDWDTALQSYQKVGGQILAITGSTYTKFETIIDFYRNYKAIEIFLETAKLDNTYNMAKTDLLLNYVSSNIDKESTLFLNRVSALKTQETNKRMLAITLLVDIKTNITQIARMNGEISDVNNKRKVLDAKLKNIDLNDSYYASDINTLTDIILELNSLKASVNKELVKTTEGYNYQMSIRKFFSNVFGFFKALNI